MLKQAARMLLTAIMCVLLVGFGVCGAAGIIGSFKGGIMPLVFGLAGLGIAWICWTAIAELWRKPPPSKE